MSPGGGRYSSATPKRTGTLPRKSQRHCETPDYSCGSTLGNFKLETPSPRESTELSRPATFFSFCCLGMPWPPNGSKRNLVPRSQGNSETEQSLLYPL